MTAKLTSVVLDTPDPQALSRFYSELLDLPVTRIDVDWIDIGDGDTKLSFQLATDFRPPLWPDPNFPQQLHLDIRVDDIDAEEAKVLRMGASLLSTKEAGFRVYSDPTGHPFCLCYD